ncbi:MAG: hypothetical protein FWD18_06110 [Micrococcales bacterium]|nr:hypothetical protein [Micrococcales bacterium]
MRVLVVVTVVALAVQVVLGAVWWLANATAIPEYGDTTEYLAYATTFAFDGYRTLAYPLAVRAALELGAVLSIPWVVPLYTVQLIAAVLANLVLVRALLPKARRVTQAAWTAVLTTIPLPLHYTVVVLTDSFATSSFLVFIAGLVRATVHQDRSWRTAALLVVGAVASVAIRADRVYLVLLLTAAAVLALVVRWRRARDTRPARRPVLSLLVLVLLVAVPSVGMEAVNRATQTENPGRVQATLPGAVFGRTVDLHIDEVAPRVPDEIATVLLTAEGWNKYPAVERALGDDAAWVAIRAAVRCCAAEIAAESARDIAQGALGPYTVSWYWVTGDGPAGQWDFSRMGQHRPGLSAAVMTWSVVTTALLLVWTLVLTVRAGRRVLSLPVLALLAPAVLVASFFSLITSQPPNPRYTLVAQVVLWLVPLALLAVQDKGGASARSPQTTSGAVPGPRSDGPSRHLSSRRSRPRFAPGRADARRPDHRRAARATTIGLVPRSPDLGGDGE